MTGRLATSRSRPVEGRALVLEARSEVGVYVDGKSIVW